LRQKVSISAKNNSGIFPVKKASDLFSRKFLINTIPEFFQN
jgi:hypothetical protein